jgi:hypothetical protein
MNSKNNKQTKNIKRVIRRKTNKIRKQIKNRVKNIRRRLRRVQYNRMAAAMVKNFRKDFQVLAQTGNTMRVKGRDLVYSIPSTLNTENNTDIITIIPANPAYWTGTRVSAIASGYQNYRPIKFNVSYVPQCAVTQQGNVIAGTLWAMAPSKQNLQQTLRTSNGGMLTQCYKPHTSRVQLKGNLQFNLFRMGGKFDQEANPFIFIALSIATTDSSNNRIIPGYFYVTYEYEFKNPIGNTVQYYNSNIVKKKLLEGYTNVSAINLQQNSAPLGSILQYDDDEYSYNDDKISLTPDSLLWYFANSDTTIKEENEPNEIVGTKVGANVTSYDLQVNESDVYVITEKNDPSDVITLFKGQSTLSNLYTTILFKNNVDVWKVTDQDFINNKLTDPQLFYMTLKMFNNNNSYMYVREYEVSPLNIKMTDDEEEP